MSDYERVFILPSYVAPEHRQIIDDAENMLDEYSRILISKIEVELKKYPSIQCHREEIKRAEKSYHEDPVRQLLIKNLANIKIICERPRFMTKARSNE